MANFPLKIFKVADRSMEPNISEGDYVLANLWSRRYSEGDIVVLRHPTKDIMLIKRINRIEYGRYFVIGDNTESSEDSRKFGALDPAKIIGKVIWKAGN